MSQNQKLINNLIHGREIFGQKLRVTYVPLINGKACCVNWRPDGFAVRLVNAKDHLVQGVPNFEDAIKKAERKIAK